MGKRLQSICVVCGCKYVWPRYRTHSKYTRDFLFSFYYNSQQNWTFLGICNYHWEGVWVFSVSIYTQKIRHVWWRESSLTHERGHHVWYQKGSSRHGSLGPKFPEIIGRTFAQAPGSHRPSRDLTLYNNGLYPLRVGGLAQRVSLIDVFFKPNTGQCGEPPEVLRLLYCGSKCPLAIGTRIKHEVEHIIEPSLLAEIERYHFVPSSFSLIFDFSSAFLSGNLI